MTPPETHLIAGHVVHVDRDKRRVWAAMPLPVSMLRPRGRLMRLAREVCGRDAVWSADVSGRLGAVALCARGDSEAWAAELDALRAGGAR